MQRFQSTGNDSQVMTTVLYTDAHVEKTDCKDLVINQLINRKRMNDNIQI